VVGEGLGGAGVRQRGDEIVVSGLHGAYKYRGEWQVGQMHIVLMAQAATMAVCIFMIGLRLGINSRTN